MRCNRNLNLLLLLVELTSSSLALEQSALTVIVVDGEGAINNIRQRTTRVPIVQIEDENHEPVSGATVEFRLPETGPGGTFANRARFLRVTTGANGRAAANGFRPNDLTGTYLIRVTAVFGELTAQAVVTQTNLSGTASRGMPKRLTGWASLSHGKPESPGYGLYSYLLLASPPTDVSRPRYVAAVTYFLTQIPDIQSFSNDRVPSQLDVSYHPADSASRSAAECRLGARPLRLCQVSSAAQRDTGQPSRRAICCFDGRATQRTGFDRQKLSLPGFVLGAGPRHSAVAHGVH